MPTPKRAPRVNKQEAFTLTEVALAMGIFSFALVSMIGLLSVGLKNSRRANIQIAASNLMSAIASDIQSSSRLVQSGTYSYTSPRLQLKATVDPKGTVSGVTPGNATLDESGSPVTLTALNPLTKAFTVNFAAAGAGTTAIRVTLQWPVSNTTAPTTTPEGSLDALIPLPTP
jgi:type II secretory pathway pseudopilin PulG